MALVGEPELRAAAGPGRVRELVTGLYRRCLAEPERAGAILSGAQRELRSIRSRQRRLAVDGLYDLIRYDVPLQVLLGTSEPEALWVGLLVKYGLDPDEAAVASGLSVDFGRCAAWESELAREGGDAIEGIARIGGVDRAVADQLVEAYGAPGARAFLEASNARGPVTLRANRLHTTREALLAELLEAGVAARPGAWAADAVVLDERAQLSALPAFKRGHFEVQDEGSQLLAQLVAAEGVVVDFCAGAGGKSLAMAAERPERLIACDVRFGALRELEKRAARAGASVEIVGMHGDGPRPAALVGLQADRVLVDAPCSGMGVLRRHPEHRWLVDAGRLRWLAELQGAILGRAATLVKPGGRLIYGTCSVLPTENRGVLRRFLRRHPEFEVLRASEVLGPRFGEFLETAPHTRGTDGFFGAVLVRSAG